MKKLWNWFEKVLPYVWGSLWVAIITLGSVALLIVVVKWLLSSAGVM